jgi:hypothetical protein
MMGLLCNHMHFVGHCSLCAATEQPLIKFVGRGADGVGEELSGGAEVGGSDLRLLSRPVRSLGRGGSFSQRGLYNGCGLHKYQELKRGVLCNP